MPLQQTSGAASYDAFGGGVAAVPKYIEEYFSTFLYQGTGASNTINNGIDLATKGGLVWTKARNLVEDHNLFDTARGVRTTLHSNTTAAQYQADPTYFLTSFNSNGFTMGLGDGNANGYNYTSWTLAKAPKFFDIVTWSGNGTIGRTISHSLGSVPGCIIVKRTNGVGDWVVYHRSLGATKAMLLNLTDSVYTWNVWNDTAPTSTVFSLNDASEVNGAGNTYVAYIFAHDAGGFGLTGTDNVISCGSYTGNGSATGPTISLGYEPQWVMIKNATDATNWAMFDNMRGIATGGTEQRLYANTSGAEVTTSGNDIDLTATGFDIKTDLGYLNTSGSTFIYIAIRRGPMKVPTSGTSVFELQNLDNLSVNTLVSSAVVPDMALQVNNLGARYVVSRLTGGINTASSSSTSPRNWLVTSDTSAEDTTTTGLYYEMQNASFRLAGNGADPGSSFNLAYFMRRAPSFFDEVCYTGTEVSGQTFNHNLGAVPEMMIVKSRSGTTDWTVYHSALGASARIYLNATNAANTGTAAPWNSTAPTSSVFSLGNAGATNLSGATFVNYLFATCAGVSKVGSFTGNGSTQTINCGFTGGARFVMVKATSTTGDWMVADSARGIVAGSDPYLELNNTNAEVTGEDWLDTDSTGFVVNQVSASNANTNGVTYIFLAIA